MEEIDLKKIPEEVLRRTEEIPGYFYIAFSGELFSVFGKNVFKTFEHFLENVHGTSGFHCAFKMTCYKCGMDDLDKYRDSLEWYDSDKFDSIIIESVMKKINNIENADSYYQYLIERWQ